MPNNPLNFKLCHILHVITDDDDAVIVDIDILLLTVDIINTSGQ